MNTTLFAHTTDTENRFVEVVVPLNLPQTLTYGIPLEWQGSVLPGMRVEVALGRNKLYAGLVVAVHNNQPTSYQVKPIRAIIDAIPIISELQLAFWSWVCQYYIANPGEVMQVALPTHLKLSGEALFELQKFDTRINWSDDAFIVLEALELKGKLSLNTIKQLITPKKVAITLQELLHHNAIRIIEKLEETYKPKTERIVKLKSEFVSEQGLHTLLDACKKAPKQEQLVMAFYQLYKKEAVVTVKNLLASTQTTNAQLNALIEKGFFYTDEIKVDRLAYIKNPDGVKTITLTDAQLIGKQELEKALQKQEVVLIEGVTGSGKTLLYIEQIKKIIQEGKQVLLLVPEIALSTQLVARLYHYFGEELGVYHSKFSNNERVEIWNKVSSQAYKLIVGARSAVWLPFQQLGLVIVDEEHDGSYKQQEPAPRFHGRDAAIYLAQLHKAKVILGSATPSMESLYNAHQKKYGYVQLMERYQGLAMPTIEIVDARMLQQAYATNSLIAPALIEKIAVALSNKKQIILFQNKRGYAPFQVCTTCGWVPKCKYCSVSLTYHKITDKMHCHYCGTKSKVIHQCPACGSDHIISKSFGTERIEEDIKQLFPTATIARMDTDSMKGKNNFSDLFKKMELRQIDILIGTQMVVKGLDFANVSLVGILNADNLLTWPDFRVNERAFQLMEQVSGRAGRKEQQGEVLIQAIHIDHPVLQWVKDHSTQAYYENELQFREAFIYPPFCRMIKVICKHAAEAMAQQMGALMADAIQTKKIDCILQGPAPALINKINNLYYYELWLKCPKDAKKLVDIKQVLKEQKRSILSMKAYSSGIITLDVDPQN
jgi:primosomal protein N' (replication factor Y)